MRCLLQLRQHHVESLHEADFLRLQLLELVRQRILRIIDLSVDAELVLVGHLAWWQSCIDGVGWRDPRWPYQRLLLI